ncbi:serine/threonine phosphatase [Phormidium sp. LEGE 05292]|uniref:serine/threonine phosphatase n=1 Tax=[Phormidium] sp. LEGE 05292 TaxID=767427 RepID=UPI00187F5D0E|nr:serine/threonine phosphatase [Phormidium sp. LEGE 05292]MBE9229462.1 serine/threonine phosphatase [Phormidium sp. LEGE 05292]
MLICPQCQFENPVTNKFCQQCGASLTHKACFECGAQVSYSAKECPQCGAFTGTVWQAIISPRTVTQAKVSQIQEPGKTANSELIAASSSEKLGLEQPDILTETEPVKTEIHVSWEEELADHSPDNNSAKSISEFSPEVYLDQQQRYLLLEPLASEITEEVKVKVLDCQPLQASPIEVFILQESQGLEIGKEPDGKNIIDFWETVPEIAQAYLRLKAEFEPIVPTIHDAWVENDRQILLIEDRSHWPSLVDLWKDHQIPQIHLLQILHEMSSLWLATEPWHCRQSLLELSNLRIDEDQSLGIVRLYKEPPDINLKLSTLGQVWENLFDHTGRTLLGSIGVLINDLKLETISTIEELRFRLQEIADELQSESVPSVTNAPEAIAPNNNQTISPSSVAASVIKEQMNPYSLANESNDDMPTVVLPMQLLSLEDVGRTDVGRQRRHNEDYFGVQTKLTKVENPIGRNMEARGLYILCDGMGGHAGGEIASALAVKTLIEYFHQHWNEELPDEDCIRQGVLKANQAIYDINQQDSRSGSGRMGTTLVMVLIQETEVAVAHVGDSRLYSLSRRQGIEQITVDHEVGQREIKRGVDPEIAYSRPDAYQLTQALGPRNEHFVDPDIEFFELNEDTLLLLCSDGLSDNDLIENHWQTHLQPYLSSRSNLEQSVNDLIELANQYNGHDNITAILIRAKVRPDLDQARVGNS